MSLVPVLHFTARQVCVPNGGTPWHLTARQVYEGPVMAHGHNSPAADHDGLGSIPGQLMWGSSQQSGTRAGFVRVLWFPLPVVISPAAACLLPTHHPCNSLNINLH
jgi:hypothetical protein